MSSRASDEPEVGASPPPAFASDTSPLVVADAAAPDGIDHEPSWDLLPAPGAGSGAPPPPPPLRAAETDLAGELRDTTRGSIWLARARYEPDFRHGRLALGWARTWDAEGLSLVAREPRAAHLDSERWAFLDLETTGLGTQAGTYAFLVGIAWLEADGFVIEQFLLRDVGEEPALLQAVADRLAAFEGVITFNGKTFDLPLLTTRYLVKRQNAPHTGLAHCDLLHTARRLWAHRTRDRRLTTLEAQLLGVRRHGDVPSALIPHHYAGYLRGGDAEILDLVLAHNRLDLLSLLFLTREAAGFLDNAREGTVGSRAGEQEALAEDRLRAAHVLLEAGDAAAASGLLEASLGGQPSPAVRLLALRLLAAIRKRQGDLGAACTLWEEMLGQDPDLVEPYEMLAKALEHRRRDPAGALDWVDRGLAAASLDTADRAALEHRRGRLQRKLQLASLWDPSHQAAGGR